MEREEAEKKLSELIGRDLVPLARGFGLTQWVNGRLNKGWAGQTIERYLGLQLNSSRAPNFGSWELKLCSLKRNRSGELRVKETMALTMIDRVDVAAKPFSESHLYRKLRKAIVVARLYEGPEEITSTVHSVSEFDLDDERLFRIVEADYEHVRKVLILEGFDALTGGMGRLIQPRTKGPGHGSSSRAFYARKTLVAHILGIQRLDL